MANAWRVKQYYRGRGSDSSLVTFSSVDDAKTKIGLTNAHLTTGSPTVTYGLLDSDQTLVVTFEFSSEANQTTWYNSMAADSVAWCSPASGVTAEYVRADWLNQDGSLSAKKMMEKKD